MKLRRWFEKGDHPDQYFEGLGAGVANCLRTEVKRLVEAAGATIRFEGKTGYLYHPARGLMRLNLEVLADSVRDRIDDHNYTAKDAIAEAAPLFVNAVLKENSIESLSMAELYRGLRLQLQPTQMVAPDELDIIRASAVEDFTTDTVIGLVFDTEYSIRTVPLEAFHEADDLSTLRRAASTNLRHELRTLPIQIGFIELPDFGKGGNYYCIESDSSYVSSAPIFLEEMVKLWVPEIDTEPGVLFSMPQRSMLMVRQVTTGADLFFGINAMVAATAGLFEQAKLPLSHNLHLFYDGQVETLTELSEYSDQVDIRPTPYIMDLIAGDNPDFPPGFLFGSSSEF